MSRARTLVLAILASSTLWAKAEEIPVPSFAKGPTEFVSRYGDRLLIGDKSKKELRFWFNISGANYHQCYMSGTASAVDPDTYLHIDGQCALELKVLPGAVVLMDNEAKCKQTHCGTRAGIHGATFLRKRGN